MNSSVHVVNAVVHLIDIIYINIDSNKEIILLRGWVNKDNYMIFVQNPESNYIVTVFSSDRKWFLAFTYIEGEWNVTKWVLDNNRDFKEKYIMSIEDVPIEILRMMIKISFNNSVENFKKILN